MSTKTKSTNKSTKKFVKSTKAKKLASRVLTGNARHVDEAARKAEASEFVGRRHSPGRRASDIVPALEAARVLEVAQAEIAGAVHELTTTVHRQVTPRKRGDSVSATAEVFGSILYFLTTKSHYPGWFRRRLVRTIALAVGASTASMTPDEAEDVARWLTHAARTIHGISEAGE